MHRELHRAALLMATASTLTLGACKVDNRPLLSRHEAAQPYAAAAAFAPGYPYALGPLDPAEPARVIPVRQTYDGYALAERAYAYDRVAWEGPPDYGFQYDEVEPWAWQTAGDELMFAEPLDEGYRFYYYEEGEAYPYFVRDPQYGYAYGDDGALAAVFTAAGALLGSDQIYGMANIAGAYLTRAQDMRRVYYAEPRYALASDPVWYDRWEDRAPVLRSAWQPWMTAADQAEPWRSYRLSTGERELRAFEGERERRLRSAAKFDRKLAKAEDKAWKKADRRDDRGVAVAHTPQPTPRFEGRRDRDDNRGGGQASGRDRGPRHGRDPVAVADNRDWGGGEANAKRGGGRKDDHGGGKGRGNGGGGPGGGGGGDHSGHGKGGGGGDKGEKGGKGRD
jgi:uncharacterized membrane protein YgcG